MRYLKLFNESVEETKDLFKNKINFDLIGDIIEGSLDIIDKGFDLKISVSVDSDIYNSMDTTKECILLVEFGHEHKEEYHWRNMNDSLKLRGKIGKIYYLVTFYEKDCRYGKENSRRSPHEGYELSRILNSMYPEENIKVF